MRSTLSILSKRLYLEVPSLNIALFRLIFCWLTAIYFLLLSPVHNYLFETHSYWTPEIGDAFVRMLVDYYNYSIAGLPLFYVLRALFIAALVFAGAGLFARQALTASAVFHFLYEYPLGSTYMPYTTNSVFFILVILSFSPGVDAVSVDQRWRGRAAPRTSPYWPLWLVQFILSINYFCSAISKIQGAGLNWFNGQSLQIYMFDRHMAIGSPVAELISRSPGLAALVANATFFFEATFFLVLFRPKLVRYYVAAGLLFHIAIYLTFELNFVWLFCTAYLAFVDWDKLIKRARG